MSTAVGLVLGFGLDRAVGDPRRWHPVAGFGSAAAALESATYRDGRVAGVAHEVVLVGGTAVLGVALDRVGRGRFAAVTALTALTTWTVLGGTTLARTGRAMADRLEAEDLDGARALLPSLCGRDPEVLDADGLARAAVESIAEN